MKKKTLLQYSITPVLLSACLCLVSSCGTFGGSYTDPQGVTYQGSITTPKPTTSDPKN